MYVFAIIQVRALIRLVAVATIRERRLFRSAILICCGAIHIQSCKFLVWSGTFCIMKPSVRRRLAAMAFIFSMPLVGAVSLEGGVFYLFVGSVY